MTRFGRTIGFLPVLLVAAAGVLAWRLSVAEPGPGDPFWATVVRAVDGDTLELAGGDRLRLWGVDAPEADQRCGALFWPCGLASRQAVARFLGTTRSDPAILACVRVGDSDRYGRIVARCEVDGVDLGRLLVGLGWAWDWPRHSNGWYAAEQREARAGNRGIWIGDAPRIAPWDWRAGVRSGN